MKYRHLFFDLDHTLWDFEANAKATLSELYHTLSLKEKGVNDFEQFHKNYLVHNEKLWERYRNGFIKQDELRVKRMSLALLDFKIANEPLAREMSTQFLDLLPARTILFPYAIEILQYLKGKKYELHLITNGFEKTQHSKLKYSSGVKQQPKAEKRILGASSHTPSAVPALGDGSCATRYTSRRLGMTPWFSAI